MLHSPVQALIFDLDGLLVDSEPVWFEVEGGFLRDLGHEWTREQATACMGQGTPHTLAVWRERFGVEVDIDRDTAIIAERVIARADQMPLRPGALELLRAARRAQLPMAVASSSRRRLVEAVLQAKGIAQYFGSVVSGQDVAHPKPAPDIFLLAADKLGFAPSRCLVLEDALAGVRAACAAGMQVVAVPTAPGPSIEQEATLVVERLDELVTLLSLPS